jgi:predicted RNA-binding Zn-ribbon protein involved in translation (DUF1610 family)
MSAHKQSTEQSNGPRIGVIDIETCPIEAYTWGLWKVNVGLNQIKTEWTILSVSWKWLGDKRTHYIDTSKEDDPRNDYNLLSQLWEVLNEADIIVAQNGVKFDIKKINARLLASGFPPYRPIKVVDTMLAAKAHFGFTSNKLEWMSNHLTDAPKSRHAKFPGFELWLECLAGNHKAWAEMKKYNKQDIIATEALYLRLRPWIVGHPNVAQYYDDTEVRCPKCGSTELVEDGEVHTQVSTYKRYKCFECGGFSRSRYTINSKEKRRSLLVN